MQVLNALRKLRRKLQPPPPPAPPKRPQWQFVRESDVFLVSYPKSGNTWMRMLLANYLTDGAADLVTLPELLPELMREDLESTPNASDPRILKTHLLPRPEMKRAIYIVRDGRDVAVSLYHYQIKEQRLDEQTPFEQFAEQFSSDGVDPYGRWAEHVATWTNDYPEDSIVLRYEDMLDDAAAQLRKVIEFIGWPCDNQRVDRAVEASSFERLQDIEKRQGGKFKYLKNTDQSKRFFRAGRSGQWREYFSDQMHQRFIEQNQAIMSQFGYLE